MLPKGNNMTTIPHSGSLCKVHLTPSIVASVDGVRKKKPASSGAAAHHNSFMYVIQIYCGSKSISSGITDDKYSTFHSFEEEEEGYGSLFDCGKEELNRAKGEGDLPCSTNISEQPCELRFEPDHYHFLSNLFSILDTESQGTIEKIAVLDFVKLRCPVFRRRDNALQQLEGGRISEEEQVTNVNDWRQTAIDSLTFEEVWKAVTSCSANIQDSETSNLSSDRTEHENMKIGIEGWMVFCRFVALAQYQEAKRRFSSRHLQQTMRQKNGGRGNEVVMVNVPPPEPPAPINAEELITYEKYAAGTGGIPLPELDLDHSYVSSHDARGLHGNRGVVKIDIFGKSDTSSPNSPFSITSDSVGQVDFIVQFSPENSSSKEYTDHGPETADTIVVKRSFADMEWLHENFLSQKQLGGTLCGRILPPFPAPIGTTTSDYNEDSSLQQNNSNTAAIASAGAGMISSVAKSAKSFLGGYIPTTKTTNAQSISASKSSSSLSCDNIISKSVRRSRVKSYIANKDELTDTSLSKAHQLERYLNFLLEHPALSTSFPLNVILKASQSGLECAKKVLDKKVKNETSKILPWYNSGSEADLEIVSPSQYAAFAVSFASRGGNNLSWVRTAAQAALALQLHGVLETTGYQSASAKLLHASLPQISSEGQSMWHDSDGTDELVTSGSTDPNVDKIEIGQHADELVSEFEKGVVSVKSELDRHKYDGSDEYDLLPAPISLAGGSVLCAGSVSPKKHSTPLSEIDDVIPHQEFSDFNSISTTSESQRTGYHYGIHDNVAVLGDMSVDRDIDRLRNILRALNNTLGKCLETTVGISEAIRCRTKLHLNILKGLDSCVGMRGEIIAQRALLKGVSNLEKSYEVTDESAVQFSRDLSWNTSLASAAVSAAEEVRDAVKVYRRASRAKAAADAAANQAREICREGQFATENDERDAQAKSANLQSQAMHSAVVEHESRAAKRRATLALAHDVKCWNVHRKREILETCLKTAKAQRDAARESKAAWIQLRDGLLSQSSLLPSFEKRVNHAVTIEERANSIKDETSPIKMSFTSSDSSIDNKKQKEVNVDEIETIDKTEANLVVAENTIEEVPEEFTIDCDSKREDSNTEHEDCFHHALCFSQELEPNNSTSKNDDPVTDDVPHLNQSPANPEYSELSFHDLPPAQKGQHLQNENDHQLSPKEDNVHDPFLDSFQTPESHQYAASSLIYTPKLSDNDNFMLDASNSNEHDCPSNSNTLVEKVGTFEEDQPSGDSNNNESAMNIVCEAKDLQENDNEMTDSMQSLVDGLMMWGGQWDSEDDLSLPRGMAASMVIEESRLLE